MAMIRRADADQVPREGSGLDLGDLAQRAQMLREEATRQAERILAEARVERQKMMEGAAEQAASEGHSKGYAKGLEEGHEAGKAQAVQEWNASLRNLPGVGSRRCLIWNSRESEPCVPLSRIC